MNGANGPPMLANGGIGIWLGTPLVLTLWWALSGWWVSGAAAGEGATGVSGPDGGLLAPVGGGADGDSCGDVRWGANRLKGKKLKEEDRDSVEGLSTGAGVRLGAGAGVELFVGPALGGAGLGA
jgi:hypothetical protein